MLRSARMQAQHTRKLKPIRGTWIPVHLAVAFVLVVSLTVTAGYQSAAEALTPDVGAALDRISANSMRGHLSFIASDLLEGRDTPSRGLDLAAEYIAAQFRRAGLEPAGDDGYFQTANWLLAEFDTSNFQLTLQSGTGKQVHLSSSQVSISFRQKWTLEAAGIVKVHYDDVLAALTPSQIEGKVLMVELPAARDAAQRAAQQFSRQLGSLRPSAIVQINRENPTGSGGGAARLVDPENRQGGNLDRLIAQSPSIMLHGPEVIALYDALPFGMTAATISFRATETERPVKLRNVVGILRGSDPKLRDTYVFLTAHYDHLGVSPRGDGDRISNGANDDGSGTVSVVEIASALATLQQKPKRSIVFMTVFGEEKGMLGSRYYTRHPIFPLERTAADINLEQVGRTDSTEGPQVGTASLTGFDFSDLGTILQAAGESTGIRVYKHPTNSDSYFGRSDNQAFASFGVPSHTLCVAFNYPDYHRPSDHWDKIDYENMAKVDRMVALGLVMIATNPQEPRWNDANPKTAGYVQAWRDRHPAP